MDFEEETETEKGTDDTYNGNDRSSCGMIVLLLALLVFVILFFIFVPKP